MNKIGALWTKKDKNGNYFFSGMIGEGETKKSVLIFKNKHKKEDDEKTGKNNPDYIIYESENRNE